MNALETHKRTRWTRIRIIVVAVILVLAAGRIMARSWEIQVVKKDDYQRKAKEQQLRSVQLPPTRGAILDRNGNDMAISVMVPSIYANPDEVKDPAGTARQLSPVLQLSVDELMSSLQSKKSFAWLKRRVTREEAQEVKKLELPGINVTQESKRFYPNRRLASHVLGFGGYDAVGLEGLEFEFDKELIGPKPVITGLRDAMGRMIFAEGLSDESLGRENKIVLTIDKAIQSIAEQELAEFAKLFEAKAASIVVVRPKTGEILAIANVPDFNPNLYWKSQPEERRNRAVTDRFEPGSTMKIFTMAAALDSGSVKLTDLFYCQKGEFQVDDLVIRDAHRDEWLSPVQILQRSSNIGITKVAFQTGKEPVYRMLSRFGFGARTGIPFPGETPGFLRHFSQWYDVDFASISYGHGIGVSVLQLAMAVSSIANGGRLLEPILVKKIVSDKGTTVREYKPKLVRKVVEPKTARILAKMMVAVTQEGGTGAEAAIDGFAVSGKTGTAQKPDTISGGYTKDKWIASFVGFVPTDEPEIAMAIMFDEPMINYYGGVVAAPLFRRVAEKALKVLGVVPRGLTGPAAVRKQGAPAGADAAAAGGDAQGPVHSDAAAEAAGMEVEGEAPLPPVVSQPEAQASLQCTGDCVDVPDFSGLSVPGVINSAVGAGLVVDVMGSGGASGQSVPAGSKVPRGSKITVTFKSLSQ